MKLIQAFINSNIYISLAAVFFTVEAQIQLGMKPQWHPYLFIIFFATLFEYNLHRLITVLTNKEALNSEKHQWVRENLKSFYVLVGFSMIGFAIMSFLTKFEILLAMTPFSVITLFYSVPVFESKKHLFRLREIPFLKIFLIAIVWSGSTIVLPIIQSDAGFSQNHVLLLLLERGLFIFAITVPFDLRDREADKHAGLKTFAVFGEKKAMALSYSALFAFFILSFIHFKTLNNWNMIWPLGISAATTFLFLWSKKIRKLKDYHYGILDGTMLLQGLLVLVFYYITGN